jgi:hypothetical protein
VPPGQIILRDTVTVPMGGMDVQGELVVHSPDTLQLLLHLGRARGGVVAMVMPVPYEASITGLPPGRYILRRSIVTYSITGQPRRAEAAPDTVLTIP